MLAAAPLYSTHEDQMFVILMSLPNIRSKDKPVDVLSLATQINAIPRVLVEVDLPILPYLILSTT